MALSGISRTTQTFRNFQYSKCIYNFLNEKFRKKIIQSTVTLNDQQYKSFSSKEWKNPVNLTESSTNEQKTKRKKTPIIPQISLILPEGNVQTTTLDTAEKLAKRRSLKLVKIIDFDSKLQKPVYQLMTTIQFLKEDEKIKEQVKLEKNSAVKEEKLITLSIKTSEYDTSTKIKQMLKLLKKRHAVKVYIAKEGDASKAEEIASRIKNELAEVIDKQSSLPKRATLQLLFIPKISIENKNENNSDEKNNVSDKNDEKTNQLKQERADIAE